MIYFLYLNIYIYIYTNIFRYLHVYVYLHLYSQHQSPDSLDVCWFYGEPWGEGRIIFADRFGDVCRWSGAPDHEPELLSSHFAIVFWQSFGEGHGTEDCEEILPKTATIQVKDL